MIEDLPGDRIVPIETAVKYLQLPRRRVVKLATGRCETGKTLPCIRMSKKQINFYVKDLREFAASCYTG